MFGGGDKQEEEKKEPEAVKTDSADKGGQGSVSTMKRGDYMIHVLVE